MGVLREIEGQHERFGTGVLDFNSTTRKGRLRDESDLWVDLAKLHVLIVTDFELSNATASSVGVEQCRGYSGQKFVFAPWWNYGKAKNRNLLVAENITVDNPLGIHSVTREFIPR